MQVDGHGEYLLIPRPTLEGKDYGQDSVEI